MSYYYNQVSVFGKDPVEMEMEQTAAEFIQLQNDYYMNRVGDEALVDVTTQGFWNGLRVGKRRLDDKGITRELLVE